ncbi:uncharacterized protein DUF4271 [Lacibacter cauensis]|uniref:Uncharacterized protein DUF4271 n=1 Tax=Lacibacter cauensis TaxID=510947 RepID=A0A562SRH0_9BACT|nr:DUF4271 domain-containing protein [Lacibacter cauensis]TWI83416.1 uncharacterized protein DUF4271 [Lacibacter cauensis]
MRFTIFFIGIFICLLAKAQDSAVVQQKADSALKIATQPVDSVTKAIPLVAIDSCFKAVLQTSRLQLFAKAEFQIEKEKQVEKKEWLFYYLLGIALMFGLLRLSYLRYFNDMFRVFFRTSLRVNQIREQLVQSGLQSLLFNCLFAIVAGAYVYLLIRYFKVSIQLPEVFIPLITAAVVAVLYIAKYLFLEFSGWLFSIKNAASTYSFIVFLINKIIGILLLPFLFIIAFANRELAGIAITISLVIVGGLFLYRFLRAYSPVQSDVKVGRFHFFLFFLAFEVAPLLVIYKLVLGFL